MSLLSLVVTPSPHAAGLAAAFNPLSRSLSFCGQTLKNDGLLSVWFNDEDCLAYVRDAYFLNR